MQPEQLLSHVWRVWLSFSSDNKQKQKEDIDYGNSLLRLHQLNNWADFAYAWTHSPVNNISNFFVNPINGEFLKYEIQGQMKQINSINFFKDQIEPSWEYGDNSKGGYYNFSLLKQTLPETVQQVYELLVFMTIGQSLDICHHLMGIRAVDTAGKKKFRCRFEVWVNYQDADENLGMIKQHAQEIKQLLQQGGVVLNDIKFFNIGGKVSSIENKKNGKSETKIEENGKHVA